MTHSFRLLGLVFLLCPLALAGCSGAPHSTTSTASQGRWASMANPGARYCAELGGKLELRNEQAGEAGYCHLPDGSVVEEWKLYKGKNSL